ncbi:hypothetical protein [Streptomyces sp. NPDC004533]|uniref:hypothetical protein n=1 Tax=Streptomyces sp. NPDC004533 TaxID=3154278 RepID=UPI0033A93972
MATTKRPSRRKTAPAAPPKCPDYQGSGETAETVQVGSRKKRATEDRQTAMCLTCLGTGDAPTT